MRRERSKLPLVSPVGLKLSSIVPQKVGGFTCAGSALWLDISPLREDKTSISLVSLPATQREEGNGAGKLKKKSRQASRRARRSLATVSHANLKQPAAAAMASSSTASHLGLSSLCEQPPLGV